MVGTLITYERCDIYQKSTLLSQLSKELLIIYEDLSKIALLATLSQLLRILKSLLNIILKQSFELLARQISLRYYYCLISYMDFQGGVNLAVTHCMLTDKLFDEIQG